MASDNGQVPPSLLTSFFKEATTALNACQTKEPLPLVECRSLVLKQQSSCLERVVDQQNDDHPSVSLANVQAALESLDDQTGDPAMQQAMEEMNQAARTAFARLALTSECLRTNTSSLETIINQEEAARRPLKTSRMNRSETLEFCALCQAVLRIVSVQVHLRDPSQPLLEGLVVSRGEHQQQPRDPPAVQRVENLQRLLLQAMGYDADMGLAVLARQVHEGQDDVELVRMIQQTTDKLLKALFNGDPNTTTLLSDRDQGGVTRVVSVEHSEKLVTLGENGGVVDPQEAAVTTKGGAPVSQSMRQPQQNAGSLPPNLAMAQKAAALREALVQELMAMTPEDRTVLLQQAERALQDFQQKALELPPGPERMEFMRNMDAQTQKLLAMHRIWQEQQQQRE